MRRRRLLIVTAAAVLLTQAGSAAANSPVLSASPASVPFGSQAVGTNSGPTTVTVSNTDTANSYTLGTVSDGSATVFPISADGCSGTTLAAGGSAGDSCTFAVSFKPSSTGAANDTVTIPVPASTADNLTVAVSGTGTAPSVAISTPNTFSTAPGTATSQNLTVTNNGSAALNVTSTTISGGGGSFSVAAAGANNTCLSSGVAANGGTCTIQVSYSPSAPENASANLVVNSNAASSPDSRALTGQAFAAAAQVPATLAFGDVPVNQSAGAMTVTVKNAGVGTNLAIGSVAIGGDTSFTITSDTCSGQSIAPGSTCTVGVDFSSATAGSHSATLSVTDNATYGPVSPQQVTLSATATVPGVAFSPNPVPAFASTVAGKTSATQVVTVSNSGQAPLSISAVSIGGVNFKNFTITAQTCTGLSPIAAGGQCTVTTAFRPTTTGVRNGVIVLSGNLPTASKTYVIAVTGTGLPPANLAGVYVASGCNSSRVSWLLPGRSAAGYVRAWIVRNRHHLPASPTDGGVYFDTSPGTLVNEGLLHFTRYYYRVYAEYSFVHGVAAFSSGVPLEMHTGAICSPRVGGITPSVHPTITYLSYPHALGYAIVLYHFTDRVWVGFSKTTSLRVTRTLAVHGAYQIRLYGYTRLRPKGFLMGTGSFKVE